MTFLWKASVFKPLAVFLLGTPAAALGLPHAFHGDQGSELGMGRWVLAPSHQHQEGTPAGLLSQGEGNGMVPGKALVNSQAAEVEERRGFPPPPLQKSD